MLLWKINHCFYFLSLSLHRRSVNLPRAKPTSINLSDMETQTWVKPQLDYFLEQVQYVNFYRNSSLLTVEKIFVNKSLRFVRVPSLAIQTVPQRLPNGICGRRCCDASVEATAQESTSSCIQTHYQRICSLGLPTEHQTCAAFIEAPLSTQHHSSLLYTHCQKCWF